MVAFATQVKRRRGTTAQNDAFTGAEGEIVVDTQKHTLRVHDGETQGGFEMAKQADLNNKADTAYVNEQLGLKADTGLSNVPDNYDYVVESQMPTATNGYTWYRKYKSGWVEQGGRCTVPATNSYTSSNVTTTLPIPIQTSTSAVLSYSGLNAVEGFANCENQAALSTTTVTIGRWNNGNTTAAARTYTWVLYGQAQ